MRKTTIIVVSLLLALVAMHAVTHPLAHDCPCVHAHAEITPPPFLSPVDVSVERSEAPIVRLSRSSREIAVFAPRPPPTV
jgi:hypothetical protein